MAISREEAFETFKQTAIEMLNVEEAQVTPDANFTDDLKADSLDLVEFVMELDDKFGITTEEGELENIKTVGQAFDLVYAKIS